MTQSSDPIVPHRRGYVNQCLQEGVLRILRHDGTCDLRLGVTLTVALLAGCTSTKHQADGLYRWTDESMM